MARTEKYIPNQSAIYPVSRSKIELFTQCPRCFWLDVRMKIKRPPGPPFSLNKAVDELLKKEFDSYRYSEKPHPIMLDHKIKALPFKHKDLDIWRENFKGIRVNHKKTNLEVFGAVDDIWENEDHELIVVDYKATAKASEVNLDAAWQLSYKRQVEVYQWLLRNSGFKVSDLTVFIYTNGKLELDGFNDRLEFKTKLIEYVGDDSWVEGTLVDMKACMDGDMPQVGSGAMGGPCEFCTYAKERTKLALDDIGYRVK